MCLFAWPNQMAKALSRRHAADKRAPLNYYARNHLELEQGCRLFPFFCEFRNF